MTNKPKAIVSVTNDLTTDQRAHKICTTLLSLNYNVLLVGRLKKDSLPLQTQAYTTKRFFSCFLVSNRLFGVTI
jgi:hypothetical protein